MAKSRERDCVADEPFWLERFVCIHSAATGCYFSHWVVFFSIDFNFVDFCTKFISEREKTKIVEKSMRLSDMQTNKPRSVNWPLESEKATHIPI